MNQSTSNFGEDFERRIQEQIAAEEKTIIISKNEALYLNDSLTLLIAHPTNQQSLSIPVRGIQGNAGFAADDVLILKLGEVILDITNPANKTGFGELTLSIEELFLIRECCQSYILFNEEPVGYNLMKKIYKALLEEDIEEKQKFNNLLSDVNMNPTTDKNSTGEEINDSNRTSQND